MEGLRKNVYYQLIDYIKNEVCEGRLGKGDKIPPERKLTEILGIGRNSVREALKILDIVGLVERRQGDGTYIKEYFDDWFSEPMSIALMLSETSKDEIFEFRDMIEIEIAVLAAERITDDEIEELKRCFDLYMDSSNELESSKYDKQIHYIIAKASKNPIIINTYNAMSYMLDLFLHDIRSIVHEKEGKDILYKMHKDVVDSVINRDPLKAGISMKMHMDIVRKNYR